MEASPAGRPSAGASRAGERNGPGGPVPGGIGDPPRPRDTTMASRTRRNDSYIADPERRAYIRTLREIRNQVLREHEKEIAETGFLGRVFLRFRIEAEIWRRSREVQRPPRR